MSEQQTLAPLSAQPVACARVELVVALHTLASHFENALYAFGDDAEALRKAKGDIHHAMKIASRHNQNGPGCITPPTAADARGSEALLEFANSLIEAYHSDDCFPEARYIVADARAALAASQAAPAQQPCLPNGLPFDAFGEPRVRYVRVSLDGNHCVMRPSEGDTYLKDARECGDESAYVVADVYLSEREFEDLPEHNGF